MLLDLKSQIIINPLMTDNFNTPFSPIDSSSEQKINRETSEITNIIYQMQLTDSYRIVHPNTKEHTFYSEVHKVDHILGHKTNFYKFKRNEITSCILYDPNIIKLKTDRQKSLVNTHILVETKQLIIESLVAQRRNQERNNYISWS